MKLLIIQGSYHEDGASVSLAKNVAKGFKSVDSKNIVEIINLPDTNINFCMGCKICGRNNMDKPYGICARKDDMQEIMEKMYVADRLVLVSPVYFMSVTAIMKRFVERTIALCYYPEHSWPRLRNKLNWSKKGCAIVVTDTPAPINKWLFFTSNPLRVLKSVIKMAGFGRVRKIAASTLQIKRFDKKAFKVGRKLAV